MTPSRKKVAVSRTITQGRPVSTSMPAPPADRKVLELNGIKPFKPESAKTNSTVPVANLSVPPPPVIAVVTSV